MKKEYVVFWNQENNMGFPMLPARKSAVRVSATDEDDAIEQAIVQISTLLPKQYEYMCCEGKIDENGQYIIEITNTNEDDFVGKIFDFKVMEA